MGQGRHTIGNVVLFQKSALFKIDQHRPVHGVQSVAIGLIICIAFRNNILTDAIPERAAMVIISNLLNS